MILLLKLLMPLNQNKNIRIQHSSSHDMFGIIKKHFLSNKKIIEEQLYSQVLELRITFVSTSKNMTCEYYLKQPKSTLEWNLIEKLNKSSRLTHHFNCENSCHALICEYYEIHLNEFH